jgi:hypothetical protein
MRGKPFEPGNKAGKGRPVGSQNKKSVLLGMVEERGEAIITKGILMALNGDRVALRLFIERLIPVAQLPATRFRLPKNDGELDMKKVLMSVLKQTSTGLLSPQQAVDLATFAESYGRAVGDVEHEERLAALEVDDSEEKAA